MVVPPLNRPAPHGCCKLSSDSHSALYSMGLSCMGFGYCFCSLGMLLLLLFLPGFFLS